MILPYIIYKLIEDTFNIVIHRPLPFALVEPLVGIADKPERDPNFHALLHQKIRTDLRIVELAKVKAVF